MGLGHLVFSCVLSNSWPLLLSFLLSFQFLKSHSEIMHFSSDSNVLGRKEETFRHCVISNDWGPVIVIYELSLSPVSRTFLLKVDFAGD